MGGYIGGNGGVTQVDGYSKTEVDSKVSDKVEDSQVLTDVPANAVFTDTTYSIQDGELSQNNFTDADHSKLDGIEAGATADQTAAEIKALVGSATDSNVFTDADHTKLDGIETAATADQTKSDIEGLGIDVPATNLTGTIPAARLSTATTQAESDDSTKIATTAYVVDKITTLIGGAPSTLNDLNELAAAINDDANYNSTLTTALGTKLPKSGGTMTGHLSFGDNDKAIFGAELEIYSDATHARIREYGSGQLKIQGDNMQLLTSNGASTYLEGNASTSAVTLYHASNSPRLSTTSTGIDVTGTAVMDGLTVGDGHTIGNDASDNLKIVSSAGENFILSTGDDFFVHAGSDTRRLKVDNSGDISFYNSAGSAAKFFWDSSAESLGLGTNSPNSYNSKADNLVVLTSGDTGISIISGTSSEGALAFGDGTSGGSPIMGRIRYDHSTNSMDFRVNNDDAMSITSSGSVGIGVSTPTGDGTALHIHGSSASTLHLTNSTTGSAISDGFDIVTDGLDALLRNRESGAIKFRIGSSEAMRIDASGRVGIGTSSPSTYDSRSNNLVVGDSGDSGITIFSGATSNARLQFAPSGSTGLDNGLIDYDNNNDSMSFATGGSDRMRITSSGNVGIGTSSPSRQLSLSHASQAEISLLSGSDTNGGLIYHNASEQKLLIANRESDGHIAFQTGGTSERMRIDSSGHLLVGKSTTNQQTRGSVIYESGQAYLTSNASQSMLLTRLGAEGSHVLFYNSTTHAGTIFTQGNELCIGLHDTNIRFLDSSDSIIPVNSVGNGRNDSISLGTNAAKFKNGYFSGSLYGDGSNLTGVGGSTAYGAVGTYIVGRSTSTSTMAAGSTRAGSGIRSMGHSWRNFGGVLSEGTGDNTGAGNLSGTWRIMADTSTGLTSSHYPGGIWVRIS